MTHEEIKRARYKLGLSLEQMGRALGYEGKHIRTQMFDLETNRREIRPAQALLVEAYLSGWRPAAWDEIVNPQRKDAWQ